MTSTLGAGVDPRAFTRWSQPALDARFRAAEPGPIPVGDSTGTAIVLPGTIVARAVRVLVRSLLWQGKVFEPDTHQLTNKITPFGLRAIRAEVSIGKSWFDGNDAIVLDYSKTSFVAQMIHDEIREVAPGMYLGKVWLWRWQALDFALQF